MFFPNDGGENADGIIQLKGNHIPKGLVSLETLFDRKDHHLKKNMKVREEQFGVCENINIGTEDNPKLINLENIILRLKGQGSVVC